MANNGRFEFISNGRSKTDWGVFLAACTLILGLAVLAFTTQSRLTDLKIQLEAERVKNAILQLRVDEKKYAY